ncbi:MAG: insulinase family protein [Alphaproteobacteria bacterium]|nr:insulinase family protein [Alphaproteobacteria bacterium]
MSFPSAVYALPVQEVVSKLGVKAWLIEDHTNPTLSLQFAFRGGVEQDKVNKQGLSVLLADMLTEGAGKRDARAYQQALADNSISFSLQASRDVISGSLYGLTSALPLATELVHDALTAPRFDTEALARLKQHQEGAIKAKLADPEWQARRALYAMVYANHPYGYRSLGSAAILAGITQKDLMDEFPRRFARDNLIVAVVGDITPDALAELLDKAFGDLPAHAQLRPVVDIAVPKKAQSLHLTQEGGQSYLLFVAPGIKRDDPDWHAATLLNYLLGGGGFSSRLMQEVRTKLGLTYSIDTSLAAMEHSGLLVGEAKTANDKAGQAWLATRQVWGQIFEDGVTEAELKAAQDYLIGTLPTSFTSSGAIAGMLLSVQKENLPRDYLDRRAELLRAVTTNDIARVANRLLNPKVVTLVVVGVPEGIVSDRTEKFVDE